MVPLSIAVAAILICSGLALCIGLCIATAHRQIDEDFRPQLISAMREIEAWEQPRLLNWDRDTLERFRRQMAARRTV